MVKVEVSLEIYNRMSTANHSLHNCIKPIIYMYIDITIVYVF